MALVNMLWIFLSTFCAFVFITSDNLPTSVISQSLRSKEASKNYLTLDLFGLFELSGDYAKQGRQQLEAAITAINLINKRRILQNITLQISAQDSKCNMGHSIDSFYRRWFEGSSDNLIAVVGPRCIEAAAEVARVLKFINMLQISSAAIYSSDMSEFPSFAPISPSEAFVNPARISILAQLNWTNICVLTHSAYSHASALNSLINIIGKWEVNVAEGFDSASTLVDAISNLKEAKCRIIFASYAEHLRNSVFCSARQVNMVSKSNVWISYEHVYASRKHFKLDEINFQFNHTCNEYQLIESMEGNLWLSNLKSFSVLNEDVIEAENLTNVRKIEVVTSLPTDVPYIAESYDAVWSVALAIENLQWKLFHTHLVANAIVDELRIINNRTRYNFVQEFMNVEFIGASGYVAFKDNSHKFYTNISQMQAGVIKLIAVHSGGTNNTYRHPECHGCDHPSWKTGVVPTSKPNEVVEVIQTEVIAVAVIYLCCAIGILISLLFLLFNVRYRHVKYIKMSSPSLNNVTTVGCILVYCGIIVFGISHQTITTDWANHSMICMAHVFLFCAGFSIAFGCLFAKTFRVHFIYTSAAAPVSAFRTKLLKDTPLIIFVFILVVIDGVVALCWIIIDPFQKQIKHLSSKYDPITDTLILPQVHFCASNYESVWTGILFVYKGILLLFGAYFAYEVRHVKISALNDSHYIGACIYNVATMAIISAVIYFLLRHQPTMLFITTSLFIFVFTSTAMGILFIPKVYSVLKGKLIEADLININSLRIQGNTRRLCQGSGFDFKDCFLRVQIQNRVFRHDLKQLDDDIIKLQHVLNKIMQKQLKDQRRFSKLTEADSSLTNVRSMMNLMVHVNKRPSQAFQEMTAMKKGMRSVSRLSSQNSSSSSVSSIQSIAPPSTLTDQRASKTGAAEDAFTLDEAKAIMVHQTLALADFCHFPILFLATLGKTDSDRHEAAFGEAYSPIISTPLEMRSPGSPMSQHASIIARYKMSSAVNCPDSEGGDITSDINYVHFPFNNVLDITTATSPHPKVSSLERQYSLPTNRPTRKKATVVYENGSLECSHQSLTCKQGDACQNQDNVMNLFLSSHWNPGQAETTKPPSPLPTIESVVPKPTAPVGKSRRLSLFTLGNSSPKKTGDKKRFWRRAKTKIIRGIEEIDEAAL